MSPNPVVGMVGAGQLARMTHQAAVDLDVDLVVLAESPGDPAVRAGARAVIGSPNDADALLRLAAEVDVVTFDHEHVPTALARALESSHVAVRPSADALVMAQDKLRAREGFGAAGLPVPAFTALGADPAAEVSAFASAHGWPVVLKARRGGYDGKGVAVARGIDDLGAVLQRLAGAELLVEAHVDIAQEVAVVGARSPSGGWAAYPVVATLQHDGICHELFMPARLAPDVASAATSLARSVAERIDAVGIIAVELFLTRAGDLVVNEIALRPHNSGHATIEGAVTSQFHNHLRAVLDWPLGDTSLRAPAAAMANVLGPGDGSDPRARLREALAVPGASVHLYGKTAAAGRKLGHVTALGAGPDEALDAARRGARILMGGDATG